MLKRVVRAWRSPSGEVSWALFATYTVAEAASLWLVWVAFGARPGLLLQIPVLGAGLMGWLALTGYAAEKRPLVPIPELSMSRKSEVKRAWTFVTLMHLPLLAVGLGIILIALLILGLGGGFFWVYVTGLPSQALWNRNWFRSKYIRYVWGPTGEHASVHAMPSDRPAL